MGITIIVFPDHEWVEKHDLSEMDHRGDDYMEIEVPEDVDDIDLWVEQTRPQDPPEDDDVEYLRTHPKRVIHNKEHHKGNRHPDTCYWCSE